ncbi:MAG: hypothetical protein Q9219_002051 [cf. Caloplaca sp. 3 TL-2023]
MELNGSRPLTSVELVQQQQHYRVSSASGFKRPFKHISSAGSNPPSPQATTTTSLGGNVPVLLSKSRQALLEPSRLIASKICRSAESENETNRAQACVPSQPSSSVNPLLVISCPRYGLPESLVRNFATMGIDRIYPWQSSCLLGRGLLTGEKNLVYTAPTGAGKSLIADVLMLKRVLASPRTKAILVLPYVALVQEKANMLVNTAIEQCTIDDLGVVVLDELHMIDDDHRGYLMELLATKILSLEQNVQLVGMSATLPNTQLLARWLDAKYYESKYNPVPVKEYLVVDNSIYPSSGSSALFRATSQGCGSLTSQTVVPTMTIQASSHHELRNSLTNAVVSLAIETALDGYGALIFCSSRQACQVTALLVSQAMPECNSVTLEKRQDVVLNLRSLPVGLDEALEKTVPWGVAFHHAGLTGEEREIIAKAYDSRVINVIVATCSLAAGINLPARRVILQGARMGRDLIGPAMLKQMRGRAGRKGKDEIGESFLCCHKEDLGEVVELLEADLPKVESSMTPEKRGIKR